ncbi:MAG: FHA domain-containing protein, partial [Planctomycetota bacterium]
MAQLIVQSGELKGQTFPLKEETTLGRLRSCDITINDEELSRKHSKILLHKGKYLLLDLQSRNGTYVNGKRVQKQLLQPGDKITVGNTTLLFVEKNSTHTRNLSGKKIGKYLVGKKIYSHPLYLCYQAKQTTLERSVLLKVLQPHLTKEKKILHAFLDMAKKTGKLSQENLLQIFDVGEDQGEYFICCENVDGLPLADALQSGEIPLQHTLNTIQQLAQALLHLHNENLYHKELTPLSVFLTTHSNIKLMDVGLSPTLFGLKLPPSDANFFAKYASPELIRKKNLSPASDIYSLGILCFQLLAGIPPFQGKNPAEILKKHLQLNPPPLATIQPELPTPLTQLVDKMLSKKPIERPTAKYILDQLQSLSLPKSKKYLQVQHARTKASPAIKNAPLHRASPPKHHNSSPPK